MIHSLMVMNLSSKDSLLGDPDDMDIFVMIHRWILLQTALHSIPPAKQRILVIGIG